MKKLRFNRVDRSFPSFVFSSRKEYDDMIKDVVRRIKSGEAVRRCPQMTVQLYYCIIQDTEQPCLFIGTIQEFPGSYVYAATESDALRMLYKTACNMRITHLTKMLRLIGRQEGNWTPPRASHFKKFGWDPIDQIGIEFRKFHLNPTKVKLLLAKALG